MMYREKSRQKRGRTHATRGSARSVIPTMDRVLPVHKIKEVPAYNGVRCARISVRQTHEEWKLLQVLIHLQYEEKEDTSKQGEVINMTDPCLTNGPVQDPQLPRGEFFFGRRICRINTTVFEHRRYQGGISSSKTASFSGPELYLGYKSNWNSF